MFDLSHFQIPCQFSVYILLISWSKTTEILRLWQFWAPWLQATPEPSWPTGMNSNFAISLLLMGSQLSSLLGTAGGAAGLKDTQSHSNSDCDRFGV